MSEGRFQAEEIFKLIEMASVISILSHHRPDGDSAGSTSAMKLWLQSMGKEVRHIYPSSLPSFLHFLPEWKDSIVEEGDLSEAEEALSGSDLIIHMDFSQWGRQGPLAEIERSKVPYVCIDHHLNPDDDYNAYYWSTEVSSTCQLMYCMMNDLNREEAINPDVATCLFTGLMTDTGSFKHSNTTPEVHRIAASLLEKGARVEEIRNSIEQSFELKRLKFFGHCLSNKLQVVPELSTSYILVSKEEIREYDIKPGGTEGLVNYGLSIKNIELTALLTEHENEVRFSLRSLGLVPASEIASRYFNGGGHYNAAGGRLKNVNIAQAEEAFLAGIKEFFANFSIEER